VGVGDGPCWRHPECGVREFTRLQLLLDGAGLQVLVVSVVLLGLPHGAVDHLAVPRTRGEAVTAGWLAAVGALYLVAGGAYAIAWFLAPAAAAAFFILLTWAHWGQGEIYPLAALSGGDYPPSRRARLLTAATRGALPMVLPLAAFPAQYERVVVAFVGLFDPAATAAVAGAVTPTVRIVAAGTVLALAACALGVGFVATAGDRTARRIWRLDAAETGLLFVFFSAVPPLLAVGLYFCLWHSLRHVVRLIAVDPRASTALDAGRYAAAFGTFARDAAPLTAAAALLLAGVYLVVPAPIEAPLDAVAAYLVLIAVLTLPHVAVVAWMDREQRLWGPGTTGP